MMGRLSQCPSAAKTAARKSARTILVTPDDLPVLLNLDVEALHQRAAVRLPPSPFRVKPQSSALLAEPFQVPDGEVLRRPDQRRQLLEALERALVEHRHRDDGQPLQQLPTAWRA